MIMLILLLTSCKGTVIVCETVRDCDDGHWCDECSLLDYPEREPWYECSYGARYDPEDSTPEQAVQDMLVHCVPSVAAQGEPR